MSFTEEKDRHPYSGDRVSWGGLMYHVQVVGKHVVHLCSLGVCWPVSHWHLEIVKSLLVWDAEACCFRAFWDKKKEAA